VVLYTVLLDVDNADNALMAEMTTQVFSSPAGQGVLTVPVAALQGSTSGPADRAVVAANGDIQQREVRTGLSDRLRVQIARRPQRRRSPVDRPGRRQRRLNADASDRTAGHPQSYGGGDARRSTCCAASTCRSTPGNSWRSSARPAPASRP
jgi:hypothetical protein